MIIIVAECRNSMANCGQALGPPAWTWNLCKYWQESGAFDCSSLGQRQKRRFIWRQFMASAPKDCERFTSKERLRGGIDLPAFSLQEQIVLRAA
jgi:hypothetical protein